MITVGALSIINIAKAENKIIASVKITLENCHLKGIKAQVKCAKLTVPENYQQSNGAKIDLNIAVLPAIDNSENKTPFMFLAGGPGQAAVELAAPLWTALNDIRKTRDIILVDQRGTGKSNPLSCEDDEVQNVYQLTQKDFTTDEIKKCISKFKVGDLAQYNSENAIRDFDAVRQALGYKQVNLYGGSYGTRAALVYMRMFPESIRSVVLDGVGPIEVPIGLFGQSAARSFELLLQHCQQEDTCNKAYPNLKNEFKQLVTRLEAAPVKITIPHPRLGTKTQFVIDKDKLIANLRMQLYSVEMRTLVPLVIHQAYLDNYLPFAGLLAQTDGGMGMYIGLTFNIVCNEDIPRLTPQLFAKDADNNFGGNNSHLAWLTVCPVWPQYRPSAEFSQSVTANIPTLILSGELDPVTPPSNGEYPAKTLPNSKHIIIKNSAHTSLGTCAPEIINEFLTTLNVNELDESCLEDIPVELFMTNLNGSI
ncbi:MAG: alpha/beta hydrolase [Gammaproteobacteria bacterium]|nr:MAG: alpha/beta hydrolase [Gammaproteobacteria bacterium]